MNIKSYTKKTPGNILLLQLAASLLLSMPARAQTAVKVLGQSNFTTGITANPSVATSRDLYFPAGMAGDGSGNLYVAENRNRVLIFKNAGAKANGAAADYVLGQTSFTTSSSGSNASKFNLPVSLLTDGSGNLYVGDYNNNRVLIFKNIESRINNGTLTNGPAADYVIGQPNLTSRAAGESYMTVNGLYNTVTNSSLWSVGGLAMDAAGNLFVVDYLNFRVLMFPGVRSAVDNGTFVNGIAATKVLGRPDFNTGGYTNPGASDQTFFYPQGLAVDAAGNLYVADRYNNRVLRFNDVLNKADGGSADAVFGQPNFTYANPGPGAAQLGNPYSIAFNSANELLVSESNSNGRISRFQNPGTAPTGIARSGTIGANDLVTYTPSATNNGALMDIVVMPGSGTWVIDQTYQRILLFQDVTPLPLGLLSFTAQSAKASVQLGWELSANHPLSSATVQRSADSRQFEDLATLSAGAETRYTYTDNAPLPGCAYYRLRLQQQDGKISYSRVRTVNGGEGIAQAWPNPAADVLHVRTGSSAPVKVWMTDGTGKTVVAPQYLADGTDLSIAHLPQGMYLLHIANTACLKITK